MQVFDSLVIGAGQGGLSASYHLNRLGLDHVVLDRDSHPGGAWQHRWDSLTMPDVHGVADLPGLRAPAWDDRQANVAIPEWFARYESEFDLPVLRPVHAARVERDGTLFAVHTDTGTTFHAESLINATGTWTRPFVPHYPGADTFSGEQFHTVDYPGPEHFRGKRVVVVGGGASAVQFLGEIRPLTDTVWVTRREPLWRNHVHEFDGRVAIELVEERVRHGLPPGSVTSVTGIGLRPQEREAARLGAYERHPMFREIQPDGVRFPDESFEPADVIIWATGFRPALNHLAPLHLTKAHGGIRLLKSTRDVQSATTLAVDPRIQLVGYGPSASTIGGNRAGRYAATNVARLLRYAA